MIKNKPSLKEAQKRSASLINNIEDALYIPEAIVNFGNNKKYMVITYGCQANERDTENICGIIELLGYQKSEDENECDLILFNTCAIRENAEQKVFGKIGSLKKLKQTKPELIIGLCGCMAQEESTINKILSSYQHLDLVFGTHNINKLPSLILEALQAKEMVVDVLSIEGEVIENLPSIRANKNKAWVNIMYGCDKFCTYCIVPYTRGRQRSRLFDNILNEVNELVKDGYQEITLLGQNVNAYGKDLSTPSSFALLLEAVAQSGIPRLRFMTSHPWDFSDEMIAIIARYDNIMPFIHLPVQAGDNDILKIMNRLYKIEDYKLLFDKLKTCKKDDLGISMSTDIIVGFPNETEEQFQKTLALVDYCQFDNAFTFVYSPRNGTPAAAFDDNVSLDVKKERLARLNNKVNDCFLKQNQRFLNKNVKVLIDGYSKKNKDYMSGYSEHNKLVNLKAAESLIGKIVSVKITGVKSFSLEGELVE
ncbi:MAG: tRNA (N6-isopentenyl adenosine(37)-C2)-methylthiotransferase MiaB [Bacilli bacterium]|nr:tRNA (N6-isopentenyl adenosine(37)-C2)-methylthiotransferase MiaB [Bacilli bacterium]